MNKKILNKKDLVYELNSKNYLYNLYLVEQKNLINFMKKSYERNQICKYLLYQTNFLIITYFLKQNLK